MLHDGTYGVDLQGNGDEINLIYNAGAGTDPTEITGSWDVVFCVPTNATPGILATGSTDAWSHPHSAEVLTDAFCQTAYASSAWSDVGTPVTPVSVEFNGSTTLINAGDEALFRICMRVLQLGISGSDQMVPAKPVTMAASSIRA